MLVSSGASINALSENKNIFNIVNNTSQKVGNGYTNITVQEAWDYLNGTCNGVQIPIDVRRTWDEWYPERIDTPLPEHPRHFVLDLFQNSTTLPIFLERYAGLPVIIYCKGGYRSFQATKILVDNNFTGEIYNMVGGITAWKAAGLPITYGGFYNITVDDTWALCSKKNNGLQTPVDVRYDYEWNDGFIKTPYPENPIWYTLDLLKADDGKNFSKEHIGKEVVLYCKGGYRSTIGSYILYYANFSGTVYNMLGGYTDWVDKGHPTRGDNAPSAPNITGDIKVKKNTNVTFEFLSQDPDDDVLWYWISWGDGCPSIEWLGPYKSGVPVEMNHTFAEKGTYTISAQTRDPYGNESELSQLEIQVPKTKAVSFNMNLLEWLINRFPNAFPTLRNILIM
jgi:rhodanese-related sulfurtransferase